MIESSPEWDEFSNNFEGGTVALLGRSDTGKSTFCRFLLEQSAGAGRVAYIDGDCGQSTLGPPGTAGMAVFDGDVSGPVATRLRFIGDTSPAGHLLLLAVALKRLAEAVREYHPRVTIIDSSGYVQGEVAREFQASLVELLRPDHLVAIQDHGELEPILSRYRRHPAMQVHRFPVHPAVRARSRTWRARYREERFRSAFTGSGSMEIDTTGIAVTGRLPGTFRDEDWSGLLLGLNDADGFMLALAVAEHCDPARGRIRVVAPPFDREALSSVQVGTIRLHL